MSNGWKFFQISEIADIIDSRHKTPKYEIEGLPMVRAVDINNGILDLSETRKVSQPVYDDFSKGRDPEIGDILISRVGHYLGKVSYVSSDEKFCMGQNIALLIPKESGKFLFYFLMSPLGKYQIDLFKVGAAQPTLSLKSIKEIPINLPPLPEQKAIAHILATLDDKIELNRKMNQTLEAMAQALFKSWFVDFDPVLDNALAAGPDSYRERIPDALKAKAAKRLNSPSGLEGVAAGRGSSLLHTNPTLAKLFPSSFTYNETLDKWVPEGWHVKKLGECVQTVLGGTPSTKNEEFWTDGTIGWLNSGKVNEFRITEPTALITEKALNNSATKLMPSGTTLLAITGATLGQISKIEKPFCANQSVVGIIGNDSCSNEFIYLWLHNVVEILMQSATGGAQQHVNKNNVNDLPLIIPVNDLLREFDKLVKVSFEKIAANCFETKTLTQLRDTLLPQLISGKVRVPEEMTNP